jgi:hypothetical protein
MVSKVYTKILQKCLYYVITEFTEIVRNENSTFSAQLTTL